jgi:hypothetical protein
LELVEQVLDGDSDTWAVLETLLRRALAGDREYVREVCALMRDPVHRLEEGYSHGQ